MFSLREVPPTADEARIARELMEATFAEPSGPLPGAMPEIFEEGAPREEGLPHWSEAFDGLAEGSEADGAPASDAHVVAHGEARDDARGDARGEGWRRDDPLADAPGWMAAFDGDDEDEERGVAAGTVLEDPPVEWAA